MTATELARIHGGVRSPFNELILCFFGEYNTISPGRALRTRWAPRRYLRATALKFDSFTL
jgi:hypothetical protein